MCRYVAVPASMGANLLMLMWWDGRVDETVVLD